MPSRFSFVTSFAIILAGSLNSFAESLPVQPSEKEHPGSSFYSYTSLKQSFKISGRDVDTFCPKEIAQNPVKAPVLVFGHGQAMDLSHYNMTFEHLAKKGFCVIFPTYDTGFFDQEWRRMGSDFVNLTNATLKQLSTYADASKVVFSGHSKGAYVALVASGLPANQLLVKPSSVILFAPAGFDEEYLRNIDPNIPLTLVYGEADTIIKKDLNDEIYEKIRSSHKQFIFVKSYTTTQPSLAADHFFIANKKSFFGGRNGVSSLHFFGAWKWLVGGLNDLKSLKPLQDPYLYGGEAGSTGLNNFSHEIKRSW
jgi:predicted esterase